MNKILKSRLKTLRVNTRNNFKYIIDSIIDEHWTRIQACIFCGSKDELTKEHIVPRWTYQKSSERHFINNINKQRTNYEKATVPCCKKCNSDILSSLERHIARLFLEKDVGKNLYTVEDYHNVIRWLEIIDYKFQVHDLERKFICHKEGEFNEYCKNIPLAMMSKYIESPAKAFRLLRKSLRRVTTKSKDIKENSIMFISTKNKSFNFIHGSGEMIFIELPQFRTAVFYFLGETFKTEKVAQEKAQAIIANIY